jgi:MFS family permease
MADVHATGAEPSIFAPLAHRDFAVLWGGFVVSHIGDSVQLHAQAWLVTELTRSGLKVGTVALCQAIPRLLLGLFAGVFVDRFDRRRLLIVTQTLAMLQSVTFAALVLTHHITYGAILVLATLLGIFDTLNLNARVAMMPTLVPRNLIGKAVALQALGVNVVQIAGPAMTAILIGTVGVSGCILVNAATFVILLVALAWLNARPNPANGAKPGMRDELREGFSFVRARPLLWGSIALAYLLGFFGVSIARLLALYARVVLDTDGRGYGFLAASTGVGAILASIFVTARARPTNLPRNIVLSAAGFSIAVGLIGRATEYATALLAVAAMGAGQMAFRSAVTTSIQLETPDRLRGRVVSLLTLDFSLWSLGAVLTGAMSDRLASFHATGHFAASADAHIPPHALAWGLSVTLAVTSLLCLASTAALARTILRAKLSPAPDLRDDRVGT